MMNSVRLRLLATIATLALIMGGGAALASTGDEPVPDPSCTSQPSTDTSVDPAPLAEDPADEPSTDPSEAPDATCDDQGDDQGTDPSEAPDPSDTQSETSADDQSTTDTPSPDREAACNEAAGIDPTAPPATESPVPVKGLDNAIAHVLANCLKNPDAPGLPNALKHLIANRDRQALHDAEREAAKAARDAEKAARKAAHDAAKGEKVHGNSGEHGNSGTHGNSGH